MPNNPGIWFERRHNTQASINAPVVHDDYLVPVGQLVAHRPDATADDVLTTPDKNDCRDHRAINSLS